MFSKNPFGWSALVALIGSGVAACSGADVSGETGDQQVLGAATDELRKPKDDVRKGKSCAGPKGRTCEDGEYCQGRVGHCPSKRHAGRCADSPEACTRIYAPVCGCDGVTYGNACEAAAAGVSVGSEGACAAEPTFCGGFAGIPCPEGQSCVDDPNDGCDPDNGGADCGGICVTAQEPPAFCGGIAGIPCPEGQRCVDDPKDDCDPSGGGADCGGICVAAGTCGEVTCGPGTVCCNPLRGICTKPGMVCIQ